MTSCSVAPSPATVSEAPVVTGISQVFEESTWEPANDLGQVEAALRSELVGVKASVILPTTLPDGAAGSSGRLAIYKTLPTDIVSVDVSITWQRDQHDQALSLTSMTSPSPTCEDRISGKLESGVEWKMAEIRTLSGCVATNQVGLTFIEWKEGASRYHIETFMSPDDAISWLASWREFP